MIPEKIKKWKEDREAALDLYHTTDMNVAQIARTLRISTTTADIMITGKNLPRFIREEKKVVNDCSEKDPDKRMKEARKIIEKFKECAYKESECTLGLHDPDEEKWFNDMEKVLQQLVFCYYLSD